MERIKSWFSKKKKYIGFEDVKYSILTNFRSDDSQRSRLFGDSIWNENKYILINTLSAENQGCLIVGTLVSTIEENVINHIIEQEDIDKCVIILYGKHSADDSVNTKADQLQNLGFTHVYIYAGGIFEWLLLQDIYGSGEFPTTTVCKDILRFKPELSMPRFSLPLLK